MRMIRGPSQWLWPCGSILLAVIWLLLFETVPAQAEITAGTVITVTSTAKAVDGGDKCTLRGAITAANDSTQVGSCSGTGGGPYTVVLAGNAVYSLFEADNTGRYDHHNGLPVVKVDLTLQGNGATIERAPVPSAAQFRLFEVEVTGTLRLRDVTLRGGSQEDGGGIMNWGVTELDGVTMIGNGSGCGGAIDNAGTLSITASHLVQNMADG